VEYISGYKKEGLIIHTEEGGQGSKICESRGRE
jgi:hypothetical protein